MKIRANYFFKGVGCCLLLLAHTVDASLIINIDGRVNNSLSPVTVSLGMGDYELLPLSTADGGAYTATSYGPGTGGRVNSWLWTYNIITPELGDLRINNFGNAWEATASDAFATAVPFDFSLASPTPVKFYVFDGPGGYGFSGDNIGGISLRLNAKQDNVPEPTTLALMGLGLAGIGYRRYRRKFAA